jgi:nucleotide-binding universal stress UspA family protein
MVMLLGCWHWRVEVVNMKAILVPTEDRDDMSSTLQTALLLARHCESYIEGFALQSPISDFVATDMMGGAFAIEPIEEESRQEQKRARLGFEAFMRDHGVARAGPTTSGLSFGWFENTAEGENVVVGSYGRVFDIIAIRRPDATTTGVHYRALESGLFESGRPILLAPPTPPRQIATNILIAWNGSTEQTRATAFAMPLLQRAERVTVLTIPGGQGVPGPSGEQMTLYLKRNGIPATLRTVELEGRSTGETILATATAQNCDLLIKGAYTQSRLREMIFGGTTRHILAHADLPVLMAH